MFWSRDEVFTLFVDRLHQETSLFLPVVVEEVALVMIVTAIPTIRPVGNFL